MFSPGCLIRVTGAREGDAVRPGSVLRLESQTGAVITGKLLNAKNSPDDERGTVSVEATKCQRLDLPSTRPGERVFLGLEDFAPQESGDLEFRRGDLILGEQELDPNW